MSFRFYRYEKRKWVLRKTVSAKYSTHDAVTTKVYQKTSLPSTGTWRVYAYHNDSSHVSPISSSYKRVTVR